MTAMALLLVVPLATAVATLLVSRAPALQRCLSIAGAAMQLACAIVVAVDVWHHGIRVVAVGAWPPPFGIVLVADTLSSAMVVITGVIGLAVAIYSLASLQPWHPSLGYHPLYHVQILGVTGAFLTGDIFNLYVWFEVLLMASFALLVLGNDRAQLRGAIKYVLINLASSLMLLTTVALLYGATGTLNMAHLAQRLPAVASPALVTALSALFIAAFGLKAALFPLFAWLPASYHTPPVPVMALFAGLLTKVGVYALIRVFTLLFTSGPALTHEVLLFIAGATMLTGVLGAVAQNDVRRILAIHIVSQVGYLVMGLALFTHLALASAVFFTLHVIVVKVNLFLISGEMQRLGGSFALDRCRGLYQRYPLLAGLFALSALSLAGFPPLSGFWAKLMLITAGLREGRYVIVAVALLVSLLTTFSMVKIWLRGFWTPPDEQPARAGAPRPRYRAAALVPIIALAALTLAAGLWPEPLMRLSSRAAAELLDPGAYVQAVFAAAR
jgi:multicomponent Na+:H+ antiporter subunit D